MAKRNRRKGQAVVESALVISALLLMILAVMDFGQVLFFHQMLTDRARAGARYAAANTYDATAIKNYVVYNNSAGTGSPLFGLSTSYVTVTPTPSTGNPTYVQVKISGFPIHFFTPFITRSYAEPPIIATRQAEASFGAAN